jgi:hypothetical protein
MHMSEWVDFNVFNLDPIGNAGKRIRAFLHGRSEYHSHQCTQYKRFKHDCIIRKLLLHTSFQVFCNPDSIKLADDEAVLPNFAVIASNQNTKTPMSN